MIASSGGGVSITASHAFEDDNLLIDTKRSVQAARDQLPIPDDQWWCDPVRREQYLQALK